MNPDSYRGPARFSWSAAEKWDSCGRKGWYHYALGLTEPPKDHLLKGTMVHRVLELVVAEQLSTPDQLRAVARRVFDQEIVPSADWQHLADSINEPEFKTDVWRHAVNGMHALTTGLVGRAEHVELKISTTFGDVPFLGFVDVVTEIDGTLRTLDWKTGKVWDMQAGTWRGGQAWNRKKLFQPVLYATAVEEQLERRVDGGLVAFTVSRPVDTIVAGDQLRGEAVEWLNGVWQKVQGWVADGFAEASPGPLCGWCHHVDRCPEGRSMVAGRVAAGKPVDEPLAWLKTVGPAERARWIEEGSQPEFTFDTIRANQPEPAEPVEPLPDPSVEGIRELITRETRRPAPRVWKIEQWLQMLVERFDVHDPMPDITIKPRFMDDAQLLAELDVEQSREKPRKTKVEPLLKEAVKRGLRSVDAA